MTSPDTMTKGARKAMIAGTVHGLLALLLAADAAATTAGPGRALANGHLPAQEVSAEERYFLVARSLINRTKWADAARSFETYRQRYPKGQYVSDSFYWEAFARHRQGQLERAALLLGNMLENLPDSLPADGLEARRVNDARQLRLRIFGEMAEQGDPRAAREVLRQSELAIGAAWDSAVTAWDRAAISWDSAAIALDSAAIAGDSAAAAMYAVWDSAAAAMATASDGFAQATQAMGPALDSLTNVMTEETTVIDLAEMSGLRRLVVQVGEGRFTVTSDHELPEHCEDASVQQEALTSVLRIVETDRIRILRNVIDRDDECSVNLRAYAVGRLARDGTPEAERELVGIAATHPNRGTRLAAVSGLRRFDTPTALAALVNVLARSNDAKMQEAAIRGLGGSRNPGARDALAAFAADASKPEGLRENAIVALGRRDDAETEALIGIYDEMETPKLKTALIDRLRLRAANGSKQAEAWLFGLAFDANEASRIRSKALEAWARSPSLELSGLVEAYRRLGESDLRERIYYALYRKAGRSKGEAKSQVVRQMVELARLESDPEVRERAVSWLGRTGSPEAVDFLLELLRGPQRDTLPKTGRSGSRK